MLATVVKMRYLKQWWQNLIPGGVSFAIGMISHYLSTLEYSSFRLTICQGFTTCHRSQFRVLLGVCFIDHIVDAIKDKRAEL